MKNGNAIAVEVKLTEQERNLVNSAFDALLRASGVQNAIPISALLLKFNPQPIEPTAPLGE